MTKKKHVLLERLAEHLHFVQPKNVDTLSALFERETGKPAAKWQGYLQHYDRLFAPLRKQPLRILEIGVQAGGSLEVWAEYFKHATLILGCDIDPECGDLHYEDSRIKVLVGDINAPQTLQSLTTFTDTLDVVIDDGSHHSSDIIRSFIQLFPRLTDGGIYLIEDLHCSYWEVYGGGLYDPFSAISFFKRIVDLINQTVWGVQIAPQEFLSAFSPLIGEIAKDGQWDFLADIHAIEFVNSMCVIHKRPASKNVLGPLVLSGTPDNNDRAAYQYVASEMTVPDQSTNVLSRQSDSQQNLATQLLHAREEISRLKQQNASLTTQFYESTKKFYDASVNIQQLEFKLSQLEQPKPDAS